MVFTAAWLGARIGAAARAEGGDAAAAPESGNEPDPLLVEDL